MNVPSFPKTIRKSQSAAAVTVLALFVTLRWLIAAHHEISRWVVAGSTYTNPKSVAKYLYVFRHSNGYDGQFYWRLAANPTHLNIASYLGVRLNSAYRLNRILYPALAWLVAAGRVDFIAWSLVLVNLLSLFILVQMGVRVATSNSLSAWWGLSFLLVPGIVGVLSRDLTDVLAVTFLLAGFLAARNERWLLSGLLLAGSLLTRESGLITIFAYGMVQAIISLRERRYFHPRCLTWVLPLTFLLAWQLVLLVDVHQMPLFVAANGNIGVPFVGFFTSVTHWFHPLHLHRLIEALVNVAQLIAFIALTSLAWRHWSRRRPAEFVAFLSAILVVVCETRAGWRWPFDLRYGINVMILGWLFLLNSDSPSARKWALLFVVPAVGLTVLLRIVVI